MSYVSPDRWVLVRVDVDKPFYRVFGAWSGGYLDGDSWRMNSGIESVTEDDKYYYFKGYSGSIYQCHKDGYGINSVYCLGVLEDYAAKTDKFNVCWEMPTNIMEVGND